jgi:hypothetical protein
MSDSEKLLRFQSRLNESNAMKEELTDMQKLQIQFHQQVREWEQERVFEATSIRNCLSVAPFPQATSFNACNLIWQPCTSKGSDWKAIRDHSQGSN